VTERRRTRCKQLLDDLQEMNTESRTSRSHSVENSSWKRLWAFH